MVVPYSSVLQKRSLFGSTTLTKGIRKYREQQYTLRIRAVRPAYGRRKSMILFCCGGQGVGGGRDREGAGSNSTAH